MTAAAPSQPMAPPSGAAIVVFASRERTRAFARAAFPRRRARVVLTRTLADFDTAFRDNLVDAAVVDLGAAHEETWRVASRAPDFPTVPFFGLAALRAAEGPALAQCAHYEFADVLVDGVDDGAARELVASLAFSTRFAAALTEPPRPLALATPLQCAAWRFVVAHAGLPVRTSTLASELRVTREHLSRSFAADGAPNLKRIIDLVRIVAAAELAKNPGYDLRDVAKILGFASSSHLSSTAMRIVGTKPASLARLRTVDLVERFARGHGRSRS
ncbi:MAG TPA: AraC family transcriptional regulator [Gemmatimonadaceae bacterium]|nr:AraC family transcriptional regulator [Gemmatimonadaceae bacterium]